MTIKHTLGPWRLVDAGNGWCVIPGDGVPTIASIARAYPPDSDDDEENEANAHLIAAAPELANALETLLAFDCFPIREMEQARAALRAAGRLP